MKILLTSPSRHVGGATMAMFNVALGLAKKNIEIHLVTLAPIKNFKRFFDRLNEAGVKIHIIPLNAGGLLHWAFMFIASMVIILKYRINIVNIHNPKEIVFIGIPAKLMRRKIVLTIEGEPVYEMEIEKQKIGVIQRLFILISWLLCLKSADVLISCSNWLTRIITLRYKVYSKIETIHNPIDWDRYANAIEDRSIFNFKEYVVFTAARLVTVKAIDVLIKAASLVLKKIPLANFFIAGEGPAKKELELLSEKLGVKNHFSFLGFQDDVEKFIASCDIVVLPSIYEPFGMPAAEAGACKKPVIVSNIGGLSEIVVNEVTGLTVPSRNHIELANAIIRLLSNKELAKKMGMMGYLRVKKFFTPDVIAGKYLQVYKQLLVNKQYKDKH